MFRGLYGQWVFRRHHPLGFFLPTFRLGYLLLYCGCLFWFASILKHSRNGWNKPPRQTGSKSHPFFSSSPTNSRVHTAEIAEQTSPPNLNRSTPFFLLFLYVQPQLRIVYIGVNNTSVSSSQLSRLKSVESMCLTSAKASGQELVTPAPPSPFCRVSISKLIFWNVLIIILIKIDL